MYKIIRVEYSRIWGLKYYPMNVSASVYLWISFIHRQTFSQVSIAPCDLLFPSFLSSENPTSLSQRVHLESNDLHSWVTCLPIILCSHFYSLGQACFIYCRWNYSIQEDIERRKNILLRENYSVVTWRRGGSDWAGRHTSLKKICRWQ